MSYNYNDKTDNKCHCDICLFKNFVNIVPHYCEWYRDNVTFGNKSANKCPYYKPIENNT